MRLLGNCTIEEILDNEIPALYPCIAYKELIPSEWYAGKEDRQFTKEAPGQFWEQRLCFLLLIQEAIAS